MFCKFCGVPTENPNAVCDDCMAAQNAAQTNVPQANEVTYTQPQYEQYGQQQYDQQQYGQYAQQQYNQPQYNQQQYGQPQYSNAYEGPVFDLNGPAQEKPRAGFKLPGKGLLIGGAVAVVALALIAAVLFGNLGAFFVKTFASPVTYMMYLEKDTFSQVSNALSQSYSSLLSADSQKNPSLATETALTIRPGEDFLSGLAAGLGDDASWLEEITFKTNTNTKDGVTQNDIAIGLGDTKLVTLQLFADTSEKTVWMGVKELSEDYLKLDLSDLEELDMSQIEEMQEKIREFIKTLPSEKELGKLLKKYVMLASKHLDEGEKDSTNVRVNGVKQELTVLTLKIHEEDLLNIALDMLQTLKDDQQTQDLIVSFMDFVVEMYPSYELVYNENTGMYESVPVKNEEDNAAILEDGIKEAISDLKDTLEDCGNEYLQIEAYVNGKHEIVGHAFSVKGSDEKISYVTVWDGKDYAFEAVMPGVRISGNGTEKNGLLDAEYELLVDEYPYLTVEVEDWNQSQAKQGSYKGTVTLMPDMDLVEESLHAFGMSYSMISSLMLDDVALEITLDCGKNQGSANMAMKIGKSELFSVAVSGKISSGSAVKLPSESTLIYSGDGFKETALMGWVTDLDFDALLDAMDEAEVPSYLLEQLESLIEMIP